MAALGSIHVWPSPLAPAKTAVRPFPVSCLCGFAGKRIDVNDSLATIGIDDGGEIVAVQDQEGGGVVAAC
jgi:hypothetical protein